MKESLLAQLFFGELEKTHARPAGAERVASIYHLLQQLFLERTKQEQLHFNTLFARMSYTLQKYQIDGFLQANLQYFRKMAQEYPSPGVDGHALARLGFTVLAKAISFLYEAPFPNPFIPNCSTPFLRRRTGRRSASFASRCGCSWCATSRANNS
ncbi:MAG: hypothetical protein IPH04_03185 [Saprospirales bacterium]|nr:hypothetical protein [Saprospirales bacterium]